MAESILKAALFVLVANTGEKLEARRTGRGATSTRLSSVALKFMSEGAKGGRYLRVTFWLGNGGGGGLGREARVHVTRAREFDHYMLTSGRRPSFNDPEVDLCLGPNTPSNLMQKT